MTFTITFQAGGHPVELSLTWEELLGLNKATWAALEENWPVKPQCTGTVPKHGSDRLSGLSYDSVGNPEGSPSHPRGEDW